MQKLQDLQIEEKLTANTTFEDKIFFSPWWSHQWIHQNYCGKPIHWLYKNLRVKLPNLPTTLCLSFYSKMWPYFLLYVSRSIISLYFSQWLLSLLPEMHRWSLSHPMPQHWKTFGFPCLLANEFWLEKKLFDEKG